MGIINNNKELVEELSRYSRLCYERGLVGASGGNLSVRIPDNDILLVTASGVSLRDVSPENVVAVDLDGNVLESPVSLSPSKEIRFHLAIFNARPLVNAVMHVHPTYVTVYAVAGREIPLVTVSARLKLRQAKVISQADPGSEELSRKITTTLQETPQDVTLIILERHGLVSFNTSLCKAFDGAELAENTAKIAFLSVRLPAQVVKSGDKIMDLTATLNEKTHFYSSDPRFRRTWHVMLDKNGLNVSKLEMSTHSGTHVDSPLHFLADGLDIASMELNCFFGSAIAIDCPKEHGENITPEDFVSADIRPCDIVLFRTGWEEHSCSPLFFEGDWPGLSLEAVEDLIRRKVKAIGGDIASADSPSSIAAGSLVHKRALAAGIPIFEGLVNMKEIIGKRFTFIALPLKMTDCDASPVRAVALLDDTG